MYACVTFFTRRCQETPLMMLGPRVQGQLQIQLHQTLYQSKGVLCISWCQSGYCFPAKPWELVFNKVVAVVYSYPARAARAG